MKGITTVLDHKKWVFCYIVLAILVWLVNIKSIDGAEFMMGVLALITATVGANSFDKSVWRTHDKPPQS